MNKTLHIVSFANPLPADYGGAIEVYYKLKALNELGIKIIFHVFLYGKQKKDHRLNQYCYQVYYYKRNNSILKLLSFLPYIVVSRKNKAFLDRVSQDDFPILFEGIHTTGYLNDTLLKHRKKFVRMANIESNYYAGLFLASNQLTQKLYYGLEYLKLRRYENQLNAATKIIAISKFEYQLLLAKYKNQMEYIAPFHPYSKINKSLSKNYILYHGNLSVAENEAAAIYLVRHVFSQIDYKCIIAGKSPSKKLSKIIDAFDNITLINNPTDQVLQSLISEAKVNVLYTHQSTGLKLKLLNVLFNGGAVVANKKMMEGTDLESLVCIASNWIEMISYINEIMQDKLIINQRDKFNLLKGSYDNSINAERLENLIFS